MPMNGTTLETAVLTSISSAVVAEADWAAQVKKDVKDQLQLQIGDPMWGDANMDAALNILTTALGLALVPHLKAIVASVTAETIAHITANAVVTTQVTNVAVGVPPSETYLAGAGTGTVA